MIITLLTIVGSIGAFEGAKKLKRHFFGDSPIITTSEEKTNWYQRPYLEGAAWEEFRRHIAEDCKGYWLTEASCRSLMASGYRFTCAQIYDLSGNHHQRFSGSQTQIKDFLRYDLTAAGEAEEKIHNILLGTDERLNRRALPSATVA